MLTSPLLTGVFRSVPCCSATEKPVDSRIPVCEPAQVGASGIQKSLVKLRLATFTNTILQYGIGMPKGEVARSAEEAEAVAKSLGTFL